MSNKMYTYIHIFPPIDKKNLFRCWFIVINCLFTEANRFPIAKLQSSHQVSVTDKKICHLNF